MQVQTAGAYQLIPPHLQDKLVDYYAKIEHEEESKGTPLVAVTEKKPSRLQRQKASNQFLQTATKTRPTAHLTDAVRRQKLTFQTTSAYSPVRLFSASLAVPQESGREVWDASEDPAQLVLSRTGDKGADAAAKACFRNMGIVDEFFRNVFLINPVNNANKKMVAYVHSATPDIFNNAAWIPDRESIYYGEVDPKVFRPLVDDLGITAHEFGHAVTQYSSDLIYQGQSGALNESISDVFAIMIDHRNTKARANSPDTNWLIAKGIVVNRPENGTALRSMNNPGTAYRDHPILGSDSQPAHMSEYDNVDARIISGDNGGVHIYSGIPNRAFYLAASEIGGFSWEKAGQIWYRALVNAQSNDDFATFANRTLLATRKLKYNDAIFNIVGKAWRDVGVDLRNLQPVTTGIDVEDSGSALFANATSYFNGRNIALVGAGLAVAYGLYRYKSPAII